MRQPLVTICAAFSRTFTTFALVSNLHFFKFGFEESICFNYTTRVKQFYYVFSSLGFLSRPNSALNKERNSPTLTTTIPPSPNTPNKKYGKYWSWPCNMTYISIKETGINRKIINVMSRIARLKRYRRLDRSIWWYRIILLRWSGTLFTSSTRQQVGKARYSCENVVKVHAMQLYKRT